MMPEMSKTLFNKYKVENCFYGEFFDMMDPAKGWVLEASEPRYMSNYYGIRNRLGILNENYVYADFRSRVLGCYNLIASLMDYANVHAMEIKKLLHNADSITIARGSHPSVADSFAIEYDVRPSPEKVTVKTFEAEIVSEENGRKEYRKSDRQRDVTIPYYIDFYPVKSVKFPYAYLLSINDPEIIALLGIHGVQMEKLAEDSQIKVECFEVSELKGASRLNQGHYTNTINGRFVTRTINFPEGTIVVRTSQPLANLAAYLLEPQSNDGLVTWNFLDRYLVPQWGRGYNSFPVYKILVPVVLHTTKPELPELYR
jgi:dipeptidyl-peptidase-4